MTSGKDSRYGVVTVQDRRRRNKKKSKQKFISDDGVAKSVPILSSKWLRQVNL